MATTSKDVNQDEVVELVADTSADFIAQPKNGAILVIYSASEPALSEFAEKGLRVQANQALDRKFAGKLWAAPNGSSTVKVSVTV